MIGGWEGVYSCLAYLSPVCIRVHVLIVIIITLKNGIFLFVQLIVLFAIPICTVFPDVP